MKTVLFLGAGATRAQWTWEQHHKTFSAKFQGTECWPPPEAPLGKDFVRLASQRCIKKDFPSVREYLQAANLLHVLDDVEDLFTAIFEKALPTDGDPQAKKAWHHLLVCYRKLTGCSTIVLTFPSRSPLPLLFNALSKANQRLEIVTTNQDFLAESVCDRSQPSSHKSQVSTSGTSTCLSLTAIHNSAAGLQRNLHRTSLPREIVWGNYGLSFCGTPLSRSPQPRAFEHDTHMIPTHKIHGSFNWWYPSTSEHDPAPDFPEDRIYLMSDKSVPVAAGVRWNHPPVPHLFPVVVPFVKDKGPFFGKVLSPVLQHAADALRQCTRLVVFGYGFSPADTEAVQLLQDSLNARVKEMAIIDKSADAPRRLRGLRDDSRAADGHKVKYYRSVKDFLAGRDLPF